MFILYICLLWAGALFHNFQLCIGACGKAEYEVNGECCSMCNPGYHVSKHCTEYTNTSCVPCSPSTYTDLPNGLSHCFPCTVCDSSQGLRTKTECTLTTDTICESREGFHCIDQHKHSCRAAVEHSTCKPGQYIRQNGTADTDTVCGDCVGDTYSDGSFTSCRPHTQPENSNTNLTDGVVRLEEAPGTQSPDTEWNKIYIAPIVLGVLFVIMAVGGLICYWHKKRSSNGYL